MAKLNVVIVDDATRSLKNLEEALVGEGDWEIHLINPTSQAPYLTLDQLCERIKLAAGEHSVILLDHEFFNCGYSGEDIVSRLNLDPERSLSISSISQDYLKHSFSKKDCMSDNPRAKPYLIKKIKEMAGMQQA